MEDLNQNRFYYIIGEGKQGPQGRRGLSYNTITGLGYNLSTSEYSNDTPYYQFISFIIDFVFSNISNIKYFAIITVPDNIIRKRYPNYMSSVLNNTDYDNYNVDINYLIAPNTTIQFWGYGNNIDGVPTSLQFQLRDLVILKSN